MIRADTHVHTACSPDGAGSIADTVRSAAARGLDTVYQTEHSDCNGWDTSGMVYAQARVDASREELRRSNPTIATPYGIEIGQAAESPRDASRVLYQNPALDFVLGSLHNLAGEPDFSQMEYDSREQCEALLRRYVDELWTTVTTTDFDSLAHIGYPLRYPLLKKGIELSFDCVRGEICDILIELARRGKALELNTNPVRKSGKPELLCPAEIKYFREHGGELVTVGSDAHCAGDVGADFDVAEDMLRDCGFESYTVFIKRRGIKVRFA